VTVAAVAGAAVAVAATGAAAAAAVAGATFTERLVEHFTKRLTDKTHSHPDQRITKNTCVGLNCANPVVSFFFLIG
jgi:hypothetical protein